ncbi:VWA domain-containing protein [Maribacter algicola]|uniref:VWA domain-containing protein n=1 Tax=Meishania litoralis TaxID=3434685 RepID=A0ACC7LJ74_9FLAO
MDTKTVLLIVLAGIIALAVVVFQYYKYAKKRRNLAVILSFLRFIALLAILLLLINPKFSKQVLTLQKTNLIVLADNSSSVASDRETIDQITASIKGSTNITDQFNVSDYRFDTNLSDSDTLDFQGKNTNIAKALTSIGDIYAKTNSAIVMLTDGNQTLGKDYSFYSTNEKLPVFPIVVGDTTSYEDLRVDQVNVNRFAFLKNRYPVEVYVSYNGNQNVTRSLSLQVDGKVVHRENLSFSNDENSKVVSTLLEARSVGTKSVKVTIASLENERNVINNGKTVAVEVIDEKVNVGIISEINHPDIGALVKAIESNEQRTVSVMKPPLATEELEEIDLFVLYQPRTTFKAVFEYIERSKAATIIVNGAHTDWRFFGSIQKNYEVNDNGIVQEVTPVLNAAFSKYDISEHSFEGYPPLESGAELIGAYGANDVLLNMSIKGMAMDNPLMFVTDLGNHKKAYIMGENLWKWRMHCYRENQDFKNFDDFFGKLMVYLSDNDSKERLQVDYRTVYEGSNDVKISATYFDEAFLFDPNASIQLSIKGKDNGVSTEIPMLLKENVYEADLSNLGEGQYDFTLTVKEENRSKSGSFTILDFDVEQQFLSSDYKKLERLANTSGGKLFFPSQIEDMIENVTSDQRFRPIQSSVKNVVSLIDFRVLLGLIVAALAMEWFIRKYNGLT